MTTFHEAQPQSRRAVRQSERAENAELQSAATPQAYPEFRAESPVAPWQNPADLDPGRRAAAGSEPLSYSAQQTPDSPSRDLPIFRNRQTASTQGAYGQDSQALPPTQAIPQIEQPAYRARDFSPEGRRAAPTGQPSWGSPAEVSPPLAPRPGYVPSTVGQPVASQLPTEHTLSRRELRALQNGSNGGVVDYAPPAAPTAAPSAVTPPSTVTPPSEVTPSGELGLSSDALSTFDSLFQSAPATPTAPPALIEPPLPSRAPAPEASTALTAAISEFDSLSRSTSAATRTAQTGVWTPPPGHWSTQIDLDDEDVLETTITRTVGTATAATNALVLPFAPQGADIRGPLTGTGEIMLTGTIELPHSLAATGQSDRFDDHGIDALFDLSDAEVISTDSSPVRAIRAVSTHTSSHGVTHTQKPKGTRALTGLLIAASSMAVAVAGLLIATFVFKLF